MHLILNFPIELIFKKFVFFVHMKRKFVSSIGNGISISNKIVSSCICKLIWSVVLNECVRLNAIYTHTQIQWKNSIVLHQY